MFALMVMRAQGHNLQQAMPSSQVRILAAFIINASIFILSVSAHDDNSQLNIPNGFRKLKLPVNESVFNPDSILDLNTTQATLSPMKVSMPPKLHRVLPQSREFLIAHNKVRASLGLPLLKWDPKLARYARRWAATRVADCKMLHSYGPYGENIFWGGRDHWTPTDVVRSWVNEYKFYHRDSNTCDPGQMCAHYTQVIWKDTLRVGCSRVKCNTGGVYVICSYDPHGNYVNENPFTGTVTPATPSSRTPSH